MKKTEYKKTSYKKVRPPKITGIFKTTENLTCGGIEIVLNVNSEDAFKLSYNVLGLGEVGD